MDGIVYLLNQTGIALAQANQQIEELNNEVKRLSILNAAAKAGKD